MGILADLWFRDVGNSFADELKLKKNLSTEILPAKRKKIERKKFTKTYEYKMREKIINNIFLYIQAFCGQFWASPGGNTQQSSSCTATYLPSRKLSKFYEPDMHDTAGAGTNS